MVTKRKSRKKRRVSQAALGKPRGVIQERVRDVGPEHFGIVAVDCAKARSKWMLCDFYGKVLVPPTVVEHQKAQLQLATTQLREALEQHHILDHLVAVEMTGTYHRPVQRAFRKAGSETRLVHPFASRHYRLKFHQDHKTPPEDILRDLQHAAEQIPQHEQASEAQPLQQRYERACRSRRKSAQPISEILLAVLARYGITGLESKESQGSHVNESDTST